MLAADAGYIATDAGNFAADAIFIAAVGSKRKIAKKSFAEGGGDMAESVGKFAKGVSKQKKAAFPVRSLAGATPEKCRVVRRRQGRYTLFRIAKSGFQGKRK